jgi:hypothetical protein
MTYTFSAEVVLLTIGVAAVAAVAVLPLLYFRQVTYGIFAAVAALIAGGLLAPSLAYDKIVLDDDKVMETTGFWFAPNTKGFRLADIDYIVIGHVPGRKKRKSEFWYVYYRNGKQSVSMSLSDLWKQSKEDITKRLRAKGIEIRYHSGRGLPVGELEMSPTPFKR